MYNKNCLFNFYISHSFYLGGPERVRGRKNVAKEHLRKKKERLKGRLQESNMQPHTLLSISSPLPLKQTLVLIKVCMCKLNKTQVL